VQKTWFFLVISCEVRVDKIYTFYPDKYSFDLETRVTNLSDDTIHEKALLDWTRYVDPEIKTGRYSHEGPISYIKDEVVTEKLRNWGQRSFSGPDVSWGDSSQNIFIAAMIPEQPSLTNFLVSKDSSDMVVSALQGPKNIYPSRSIWIIQIYAVYRPEGVQQT